MNILFYRYNSICEQSILDTFRLFGCNVDELKFEVGKKNALPLERVEVINSKLQKKSYSAVFSINFFPQVSDVCNIYKIPYICWTVDCPVFELYNSSVRNKWNRIFCFDYAQYEAIHALNPDCVFYLPLAANVGYYDTITQKKMNPKFAHDISFIGSLYSEKNPYEERSKSLSDRTKGYLDGIIEAQLKLYGYNLVEECINDDIAREYYGKDYRELEDFECSLKMALAQNDICSQIAVCERKRLLSMISEKYRVDMYTLSDTKPLPKVHFHGGANTLLEAPQIFSQSKINLNFTLKSIKTGLPLRIFDIMGCGGFVLTNYQTEIPEYFTPGVHLETFASEDELMSKIEYYLSHEKERKEIAQNGYDEVKANHTWIHRCSEIFITVFE